MLIVSVTWVHKLTNGHNIVFRGFVPPMLAAGPGLPGVAASLSAATTSSPAAIGPQVPTSKPLFPAAQVSTALSSVLVVL